jgi:hypothetical protein
MKYINEIRRKFRWWLFDYLNRFKGICSANLVSWAVSPEYHDFWEINPYRPWYKETVWTQLCEEQGYCGKCVLTGRIDGDKSNLIEPEKPFIKFPFDINKKEIYIKFNGE